MTPIRTQILAKPFPSDEISEGGIYVPETARKVSNKLMVKKVGNSLKNLKEGQVIYRVQDHGTEITIDGEKHFLIDINAILATE